jgi:hypothetical protein
VAALRPGWVQAADDRAAATFDLARALTETGRERERACTLGREAAAHFRTGFKQQRQLAETERWLTRQKCGPNT